VARGEPQQRNPSDAGGADPERARFVAAFGKAASEHGYRDLTIEQVARYAGSSPERIGVYFASKEDGLVAAQDAFLDGIWLDVLDACEAPVEWPLRVRAALRSVVVSLTEASALARVFAIEATAASVAAAERQFAVLDSFARLLRDGRRIYPRAGELPTLTERALVGGVASIISGHLLAEEPRVLAGLEPQLVELILTPYIGPRLAGQIAQG
jgi:AcrR family transcriptional regulator